MSDIKRDWLVEGLATGIVCDEHGDVAEFKTEKQALRKAAELVNGDDEEVWVYALSHVVSRQPIEPIIDKLKP